jgi:hypothetical protein
MADQAKLKAGLEQALSYTLEAARDLRQTLNRLDSHDEPELLDLADIAATLQAGSLTVLRLSPEVAE